MILVALVGLVWNAVMALVNLLPSWDPPTGLSSGSSFSVLHDLGASAGSMHNWIDFSQIPAVLAAMVAVFAVSIVISTALRIGSGVPHVGKSIKGDG